MDLAELVGLAHAIVFLALSTAGCVLLVFVMLRNIGTLPRAVLASFPSALLSDGAQIAFLSHEYGNVDLSAFFPSTIAMVALSFPIAWVFSVVLDRAVRKSLK